MLNFRRRWNKILSNLNSDANIFSEMHHKCTLNRFSDSSGVFLYSISHWISTTQDNKVIYIITNVSMVVMKTGGKQYLLVLKSRVPPVVQMFALAQDWFMVFPALVPLVIFTAEHVYSGNPGDRFSAQGVISHNKRVIYNWYKAVWVYMKHGVYSKQYSLAKRADEISDYLVFMAYVGCFSSKSMVSTWIVSYLLVYTWHTPLHYPHAANAGCVLAGVAPVSLATMFAAYSGSRRPYSTKDRPFMWIKTICIE